MGQLALRISDIFLAGVIEDWNKFRIALYTSHIPSLLTNVKAQLLFGNFVESKMQVAPKAPRLPPLKETLDDAPETMLSG